MPRTYSPTYSRQWYAKHKGLYREYNWRKILTSEGKSFTEVDYDRAFKSQAGRCKICMRHATALKRRLAADHDHTTGQFRGLLCLSCNTRLGLYESAIHAPRFQQYLKGEI